MTRTLDPSRFTAKVRHALAARALTLQFDREAGEHGPRESALSDDAWGAAARLRDTLDDDECVAFWRLVLFLDSIADMLIGVDLTPRVRGQCVSVVFA